LYLSDKKIGRRGAKSAKKEKQTNISHGLCERCELSRPVDEGASSGSSGRVGGVRFTPALASVPEWHMGSFRTVDVWRGLGRVGVLNDSA